MIAMPLITIWEKNKIHPNTAKLIKELLTILSEKGEDYTFNYIKKLLKENK